MGVGGQCNTPATLPQERDPVPIVQEAGWAPGLVWTGAKNLAPHWDSIPGLSSPEEVAIPIMLSQPTMKCVLFFVRDMIDIIFWLL